VAVVDHGGFAAAGRALGIPKSKLSRRLLLLEEGLGVRLLNRSSRRFSVTEIGREFYDRCTAMLVEVEAAEQVIAQVRAEPRGVVRMSCPVALLNFQFGGLIARFMVENPAVEVHLESTNRCVDVIAIPVRFPPMEPTDLVMRKPPPCHRRLISAAYPASISARRIATINGSSIAGTARRR
jgi:DNA-binding transcriptional LysR family regulator